MPDQSVTMKTLSVPTDYNSMAMVFAERVLEIFASEDSLKSTFAKYYPILPFDRTSYWDVILLKELKECMKQNFVGNMVAENLIASDVRWILWHLSCILDFNLFSQVMLNLQRYYFILDKTSPAILVKGLEELYKGVDMSPFNKKAKYIKQAVLTEEERTFNKNLGIIKASSALLKANSPTGFRVSPIGSTPSFADAENFSLLGPAADEYILPAQGFLMGYLSWDATDVPNLLNTNADGSFSTSGINYNFISSSGGAMLNECLFSRKLASMLFRSEISREDNEVVIPRLYSICVMYRQYHSLDETIELLQGSYPFVKYTLGARF